MEKQAVPVCLHTRQASEKRMEDLPIYFINYYDIDGGINKRTPKRAHIESMESIHLSPLDSQCIDCY